MNGIDIFIILYLIFGFFISFLISFLFLKNYRNPYSKISSPKNLKIAFYYSIICFGLVIFYILIVILDHTIFSFKDISLLEKTLIIPFTELLPSFYSIFGIISLFNRKLILPIMNFYNTTGFYKPCDIVLDIIFRLINIYFNITYIVWGIIALALIIGLMIPFHEWILEVTKINSFWSLWGFIKLLLNYLNFISYLQILFYIGFAIQNIIHIDSVKRNESEKENYYIWRLGKVFLYYFKERSAIEKGYDIVKEKYDDFISNNSDDILTKHWNNFKERIKNTMDAKLIESNLDTVKEATEKYEDQIREKEENKNKNDDKKEENKNENDDKKNDEKKKKKLKDDVESLSKEMIEIQKQYTDKILPKKLFGICCKKEDKEEIKDDICYIMTRIYEEAMKLFRKSYLIKQLAQKILNKKEINCCRSLYCIKALWFIFLIFLIFLELPWHIDRDFDYSFLNFIIAFLIYLFSVIFYFSLFIYSLINHKYIQGDFLFGKHLAEVVNFSNFMNIVFSLFNASVYHSLWIFNKYGYIKAKFYDVFILPINEIDFSINNNKYTINTLDIIAYGTLIYIILSIFIASKFTELEICGKVIFSYNENTEYFFSDNEFYFYFILGCGCNIYIQENPGKFLKKEEDEIDEIKEKPINDKYNLLNNDNDINIELIPN